ncbi:MAG: ISL3 family transposase [Acidimicrobiia bacterium]|nr:ISL3 family transposase [Acidimicrobiia bacterium]
METDGRRMCEVLVGLGEVDLVGIEELSGDRLRVTIRSRGPRPVCGECGGRVWSKGDRLVRLVDLPAFGRPVRLRWRKRRWVCPRPTCAVGSFAEQDLSVAPERALLTSRAGRWATAQVGRFGRTVSEVAEELGCDWHTVNREIVRWGDALLEADVSRFGQVEAVGVDETLFWRKGQWKKKQWCTSVVDVGGRQLLDIVPGRTAESAASWFRSQPPGWCEAIRWAVLDMSGPYQVAYDRVLPHACQVADPFHVVRLANRCVDLVRRRVQNETLGAPRAET